MADTNIFFLSLGCDKNLVDSEVMLGLIKNNGYGLTKNSAEAEVIVINTCGFIMDATQEGIEQILELAELKKNGSCKSLIVTGCMAQRYKEQIFEQLPEVDAIVGVSDFTRIVEVIRKSLGGEEISLLSAKGEDIEEDFFLQREIATPRHFAYLKIAEGCDMHCTYCTIPSIRGKYRSRTMENLIKEANILADKGVKELILIAQDSALYGTDLYGEKKLHELLNALAQIEKISWIRILYVYPEHITDSLIKEMSTNPKICNYIDIPIQHSNDYILKRMGRKTTTDSLEEKIKKLRRAMPDIAIRTTLMVGFPGEEQEHFDHLVKFVKDIRFDKLGVFAYSKEEDTPAYKLSNHVLDKDKEYRKNYIMELQQNISKEKLQNHLGTTLKVIIDEKIDNTYHCRSFMDCYEIDGLVFFDSDKNFDIGEFVSVKITHSADYDLIGEVVE